MSTKLARYNEFLWAIVGTGVLLFMAVQFWEFVDRSFLRDEDPRLQVVPEADRGAQLRTSATPETGQRLVFCDVIEVSGSMVKFVPVAVVNADDPDQDVQVYGLSANFSMKTSADDHWDFAGCEGLRFNVVVWDSASGSQRLLLEEPRPIAGIWTPNPLPGTAPGGTSTGCRDEEATLPCDRLLWAIQSGDSNGDRRIDYSDATVLHVSAPDAAELIRVSPDGTSYVDHGWHRGSGALWIRARTDRNGNGKFDGADGSELYQTSLAEPGIARPIIDEALRAELEKQVR